MKLFIGLALLTISFRAQAAVESFSAKVWAEHLKTAIEKNQTKEILSLSDISAIQKLALKHDDGESLKKMTQARDLYAKEKFEAAIALYNQIPKKSDFWLEATEEKAWSYLRLKQSDKALAQTKTLMTPVLSPMVAPESYFLQALTQLKICDYAGVLTTMNLFKTNMRGHIQLMQKIADGAPSVVDHFVSRVDSFPVTLQQVGPDLVNLPFLFYRDSELQKSILTIKMSLAAHGELDQLKPPSQLALAQKVLSRLDAVKAQAKIAQRIKSLAQLETNDNFKILQKMNLIEVETTERIYADQGVDQKTYTASQKVKNNPDDMVFADDGHPWIDEVDKYQVHVNSCPDNVRRKM